jgi:hypothetical protein
MRLETTLLVVLAASLVGGPIKAQAVTPELDAPFYAWERGDYVSALEGYLAALNGRAGDRLKDEIASFTGELFEVATLTDAGTDIRIGPDGRLGTYAVGTGEQPGIALFELGDTPRVISTFQGRDPVLSSVGTVAYLRVERTADLEAAEQALLDAANRLDRDAFFEAQAEIDWIEIQNTSLWIRDVASGREREVFLGDIAAVGMVFSSDGRTLFLAAGRLGNRRDNDIYAVQAYRLAPEAVLAGRGFKSAPQAIPGGRYLLYQRPQVSPLPQAPGTPPITDAEGGGFALVDLQEDDVFGFAGTEPAFSASGTVLAFVTEGLGEWDIEVASVEPLAVAVGRAMQSTTVVLRSPSPIRDLALSPDGSLVAYQKQVGGNWEIFVSPTDGSLSERQVTNEIQHDLHPRFVDQNRILAAKGEGRHRRSYLYDLRDGSVTKLFHNNTVRTIAPEYEWQVGSDNRVVIVSERDGDTVSPERGVYVLDLNRRVTKEAVRGRLEQNLAAEQRLASAGARMFAPIREEVAAVADQVSVNRIYRYESRLFAFGSKYVTEPGNAQAIEYLTTTLKGFGYQPELQWFEPLPGVRSANVVIRIEGSTNPELVCVVSSHFDSVRRGPGADDNTSGTAALLEAARLLAGKAFPISVELAFFTGEEAGLLGSREYVRRAVETDKNIVCALNNDMVGWANNQRLDNTIRYSNAGIRDLQHAAANLFSDLITYDALYYKNTDAHAYYEVYGDIVGGIGSYPVLGNPNYHQASDRLVTINHRLVAEVSRTTLASIMLLASSPPRLSGIEARRSRVGVQLTWAAAEMSDVEDYRLRYTRADGSEAEEQITILGGEAPRALLEDVLGGSDIGVKAVSRRGLEGWDWVWVTVP